jgi:hypothetical protein
MSDEINRRAFRAARLERLVMKSALRELIAAAKNMRDASNALWHAHNPEDGPENAVAMPIDDAKELYGEAWQRLQRAEYYAEKARDGP